MAASVKIELTSGVLHCRLLPNKGGGCAAL